MSTVKLSKTQQEVVNLMAAGWVLTWWDGCGRHSSASAGLQQGGCTKKCASNIPGQLRDKGVAECKRVDWRYSRYTLTQLGHSLAQEVQAKATTTWWRVGRHDTKPGAVEVESSTAATLIINGHRTPQSSQYEAYYETREHAIKAIRSRLESDVRSAEYQLDEARKSLEAFKRKESK